MMWRGRIRRRGAVALALVVCAGTLGSGPGATAATPAVLELSSSWLETMNFYRTSSGLPPVVEEPAWSAGIANHLTYLANTPPEYRTGTYANAHYENPASPWYTPDGDAAGRSSNLGGGATDRQAIEGWMQAPFHAIGILRPDLVRSAYASRSGSAGLDVIRGLSSAEPRQVLFPGDGATVPMSAFTGELPNPLESCPGFTSPSGLPLIAMLTAEPPMGTTATMTVPDGSTLHHGGDLCVVTPSTYSSSDPVYGPTGQSILRGENAVLVIARRPLEVGAHHVRLTAGSAVLADWSFTVAGAPSAPVDLDARRTDGGPVVVQWQPGPSDGASPILRYHVAVQPPGGEAVRRATVSAGERRVVLADAAPGSRIDVAASNGFFDSPPAQTAVRGSGYWMVGAGGAVYAFGDATHLGDAPVGRRSAEDLEPTPTSRGYWVVDSAGHVFTFGDAPYLGGAAGLRAFEKVTAISGTPSGQGYWLFTNLGRVLAFGDAPNLGDMGATRLNGPVLDSIPSPSGRGYYMVASDGGVFTFGDAAFAGSMGATPLNAPVQSLVPDPDGAGYWLVASDGGIFSFDAGFHGSMGDTRLNGPITGMVAAGPGGYLMVGEDGGIFTFGSAAFFGSLGANPPPRPITAVAVVRG